MKKALFGMKNPINMSECGMAVWKKMAGIYVNNAFIHLDVGSWEKKKKKNITNNNKQTIYEKLIDMWWLSLSLIYNII